MKPLLPAAFKRLDHEAVDPAKWVCVKVEYLERGGLPPPDEFNREINYFDKKELERWDPGDADDWEGSDGGSSERGSVDGGGKAKKVKRSKKPKKPKTAKPPISFDALLERAIVGVEGFYPRSTELTELIEKEWEKEGRKLPEPKKPQALQVEPFDLQNRIVKILAGKHYGCRARITGIVGQRKTTGETEYRLSVFDNDMYIKAQTLACRSKFELTEESDLRPSNFDAKYDAKWWNSQFRRKLLEASEAEPQAPLPPGVYELDDSYDGLAARTDNLELIGKAALERGRHVPKTGNKIIHFKHHASGPILHKFGGVTQASKLLELQRHTVLKSLNTDEDKYSRESIYYGFYIHEPEQGEDGAGALDEPNTMTLNQLRRQVAMWNELSLLELHAEKSIAPETARGSEQAEGAAAGADAAATSALPSSIHGVTLLCDCCDVDVSLAAAGLAAVPDGDWFCSTCSARAASMGASISVSRKEVPAPAPAPAPAAADQGGAAMAVEAPSVVASEVFMGHRDAKGRRSGKGYYRYDCGLPYPSHGTFHYDGEWLDDLMHGHGLLKLPEGDVYTGSFARGRCSGQGQWVYPDRTIYTGAWLDGLYHGAGWLQYDDDTEFHGLFVKGLANGQGSCRYLNGSIYEGNWVNGQRSGRGLMRSAAGAVYEGYWLHDRFHGIGALSLPDGSLYKGTFEKGLPHGQGAMKHSLSGQIYVGQFLNGSRHGQGELSFPDGSTYKGNFQFGRRWGEGELLGPLVQAADEPASKGKKGGGGLSRCSYKGSWVHDTWHRQGVAVWDDGKTIKRYEGMFVKGQMSGMMGKWSVAAKPGAQPLPDHVEIEYNGRFNQGRFHGVGTARYADGAVYSGTWLRGVRVTKGTTMGRYELPDGTVYSGTWKVAKATGRGMLKRSDGSQYSGEFVDMQFHGYGELYDSSQKKDKDRHPPFKGFWSMGQFIREGERGVALIDDGRSLAGRRIKTTKKAGDPDEFDDYEEEGGEYDHAGLPPQPPNPANPAAPAAAKKANPKPKAQPLLPAPALALHPPPTGGPDYAAAAAVVGSEGKPTRKRPATSYALLGRVDEDGYLLDDEDDESVGVDDGDDGAFSLHGSKGGSKKKKPRK